MTPRLRALIIVAATVIGIGNMVLPIWTDYEPESGVAVAVLGLYGVALGLPELRRTRHGKDTNSGSAPGDAPKDDI